MFCNNCGGEIPEGSAFCVKCGAKVDSVPSGGQQPYQQSYQQQPYNQQPYGGQPPYGQPPKKKSKAWIFITGGVVLLLAIAAVLIFVVFGGGKGGWPFSGNTTQTKFANDAVEVFAGAFEGLGNEDMSKVMTEPFDIDMEVSVDTGVFPVDVSMATAYDEEVLGVQADVMGQDIIVQLDEDILYISMYGQVQGYEIDTDADLSGPMTLGERLEALTESMGDNPDVDYIMVAEAMLNSISEDCFEKSGNETTLTMTADDVVVMLETLQAKADKDDELADALDDLDMDLDEAIENAGDMDDFDLVCTITYDGGTPVSLELDYDDGTDYGSFNLQFGYEKTKDGQDISLAVEAGGSEVTMNMSIVTNGRDIEYEGEIDADGETMSFNGTETWDGDEVEGSATIQMAGEEISIEYGGTIAFGMPEDRVEDDSRFEMDKEDAEISDIEDLFSTYLFGSMGLDMYDTGWDSEETEWEPAESAAYNGDIMLGVVLPEDNSGYSGTLADAIAAEASYYNWDITISFSESPDATANIVQNYVAQGMDAVIINPDGLDDAALQNLADECLEAGIVCVMLLDEGESAPDMGAAVSLDLVYAGTDMAYWCSSSGEAFIIGGYYDASAQAIEEGLLYDSTYGIFYTTAAGSVYTDTAIPVAEVIDQILAGHPDVDTFICVDPDLAYETLVALDSIGFTGELICYTTETTMDEMDAYGSDIYVTYEYFSTSEIAYYCVMAAADQIEYDMEPQQYVLTSYSW